MSFLACQTALQSDQACFPAEVTAAQLTARLCSISQENFGTSLTLNSEADVAASIGGMCWREIQGCFYADADTDKGTGSFSCFSPLQKNSQVFSSLLHKLLSVSEVTREIKVFNKEGMQSTEVQFR